MGTASIFTREDLANSGAGPDHPRVPIRWQRRRRWLATCLLSMTTLTGCSYHQQWWQNGCKVGPNYCKPTAPVAESWIDFNDPRVLADPAQDRGWWHIFGDPVLDSLVDSTYRGNLNVREQAQRVMEYRALRAVRVGEFFPQGMAEGSYNAFQISSSGNLSGVPNPITNFDLTSIGGKLQWELDVWGRYRRQIEQADAEVERQVELYDDLLSMSLADTAKAYANVRTAQELVRLARENVDAQKGSLRLAEARFKAGAVNELDVTQARSTLEETEAMIPQFQAQARHASNELCVLVGIPSQDLAAWLGEGPIPAADNRVALGIPGELLRRRPDIRAAERAVASASAEIGVAAAELYPHFNIDGGFGWTASKPSDLFSSDSFGGIVGPSFRWNLLNFGRVRNNVHRYEARFQAAATHYQQTVLKANKEVESALIYFLKSQERVSRLEEAVKATKRSVELALTQYKEGAIDFERIYNLQNVLIRQEIDLANSRSQTTLSLIEVYRALRGGWQIRFEASGTTLAVGMPPIDQTSNAVAPPVAVPGAVPLVTTHHDVPTTLISDTDIGRPAVMETIPYRVEPPTDLTEVEGSIQLVETFGSEFDQAGASDR
jgi:NodT family efflux transporter outer membrane factor (OMF) lipoprotein